MRTAQRGEKSCCLGSARTGDFSQQLFFFPPPPPPPPSSQIFQIFRVRFAWSILHWHWIVNKWMTGLLSTAMTVNWFHYGGRIFKAERAERHWITSWEYQDLRFLSALGFSSAIPLNRGCRRHPAEHPGGVILPASSAGALLRTAAKPVGSIIPTGSAALLALLDSPV